MVSVASFNGPKVQLNIANILIRQNIQLQKLQTRLDKFEVTGDTKND